MANRRTQGSVRKLSSGRWQARVRDPETHRLVAIGTEATKEDADALVAGATVAKRKGAWVSPTAGRTGFKAYAEDWLLTRPKPLRPRTLELYRSQLKVHIFPTFETDDLGDITKARVRRWHASLKASDVYKAKVYRLLHTILATVVEDELLAVNPCVIKGAGSEHSPERPVATVPEVFLLSRAIDARYRAMVLLSAFTGLRLGECRGLRRRHLDLLRKTVRVSEQAQTVSGQGLVVGDPKTDAGRRTVAIPAELVPEFEAHLAAFAEPGPDGWLFPGDKVAPFRLGSFYGAWGRAMKADGLDRLRSQAPGLHEGRSQAFHFHDLRHTANTLAAAVPGTSLKDLMARMGHATPSAALRYQHAAVAQDAAIAAALGRLVPSEGIPDRSPESLPATNVVAFPSSKRRSG